jgi:hypothetical protein
VKSALYTATGIALGAFAGILVWSLMHSEPEPQYREVMVPVERIREVERVDTVVTWRERIVYVTQQAEQVATAPGGGQEDVDRFCAPDTIRIAGTDTVRVPTPVPQLLLRSVRHEDAWYFGRDRLILTGPTNTGDLRQFTYSTRGGYQARVHADSLVFQYPRSALLKQAIEFGSFLATGFVLGRVF